jgi:hypothetical protein
MHTNRREINLFLNSRSLASIRGWFVVFGCGYSALFLCGEVFELSELVTLDDAVPQPNHSAGMCSNFFLVGHKNNSVTALV